MNFIITVLRASFHAWDEEELLRFQKGMDWDSFMSVAACNGLEGLIYRRFKAASLLDTLPQDASKRLELCYYQNLARNMCLLQAVEELVDEFKKKGISLLLMQGMALLEDIYPALGARPMNDIDVMVREEESAEVLKTLQDMGYRPIEHYPWLHVKGGLALDVHHDPANTSRIGARRHAVAIPVQELWRDSAPLPKGKDWRIFCWEDLLLTLCAHLQKHSYSRLIWFMDIGLIVKGHRGSIDWERLLDKAGRYKLEKPLFMVFSRLKYLFHLELPADVQRKLSTVKLNPLEKEILRRLKDGREVGRVGELLFAFSLESPRLTVAYLLETAFPRREILAQVYGISSPKLLWSAYPLRFCHLLKMGVSEAVRILRT